jgi:hypothetical protein
LTTRVVRGILPSETGHVAAVIEPLGSLESASIADRGEK